MDQYYFYLGNNTQLNLARYIEEISWEFNDLDAPKSGRDLGGIMHRGKVAEKGKLYVKLIPVTAALLNSILSMLRTEYVDVNTNLVPGGTFKGYNSSRKGGVMVLTTDGIPKHKDVSFNIIER